MYYKLVEESGNYQVFETSTEQVIKSFPTKTEARSFMRKLNGGVAFNGWTPSFFLKKLKIT